jgi:antirestriction protein ArdC
MAKLANHRVVKDLTEKAIISIENAVKKGLGWKPEFTGSSGLAHNMFTGHVLTGGNQLVALFSGSDDRWATPNALKAKKIAWKKGSKVTWFLKPITITKDRETGKDLKNPFVTFSSYKMLNGADIVGLPQEEAEEVTLEERHIKIDELISTLGADIRESSRGKCFYSPKEDYIHMPFKGCFNSLDSYYATLFHEVGHWTGHKSRLDRLDGKQDKSEYAFEELVAELFSIYMSKFCNISFEPTENNATYLSSWLKALKQDPSFLWKASGKATDILNYVLQAQEELKKAA